MVPLWTFHFLSSWGSEHSPKSWCGSDTLCCFIFYSVIPLTQVVRFLTEVSDQKGLEF